MTAPRRPMPEVITGTPSHRLIRGVMQMDIEPLHVERVVLFRGAVGTLSLVDTGAEGVDWTPDADATVHILWQMDEGNGWIEVDDVRYPIVPGDTMSAPGGSAVRLASGMLLVQIEGRGRSLDRVLLPDHGDESFEGYNRRTTYGTSGGFSLERWKITQPLTIPAPDAPYVVMGLAVPLALTWHGGIDLIGRGECRAVSPETGSVTLLPNGLGYALVMR